MKNIEYEKVPVKGEPKLIMRYYENKSKLKGIIVFVHGVSHGAWCWDNFADYFTEKGYICFAVNLRGHGDNEKCEKSNLEDYVNDVSRCIDSCKIYCENNKISYSEPSLLGHSMGGCIVEKYIGEHSNKVKNAILFAPVTAQGMGMKRILLTSLSFPGFFTSPTILGCKRNMFLRHSNFFVAKTNFIIFPSRITNKAELKFYKKHLCGESIPAMFGLSKFDLSKPDIPVFVIGSDKDAYFPQKSLKTTADFYETKPMILRGLCHDMMLDPEWDKAAQSVLEFIERPDELKRNPETFINDLEKKIYPEDTKYNILCLLVKWLFSGKN